MIVPFIYPDTPHVRRHGPSGYLDYGSFRPWIRDEFEFRCVYCLTRERWGPGGVLFALDHFLAVAQHPALETNYDNLVFVCANCNSKKGDKDVPNPLVILLNSTVEVLPDGTKSSNDPQARRLLDLLRLNDDRMIEFRRHWIAIASLAARHDQDLFLRLMGYPDDLPDLSGSFHK